MTVIERIARIIREFDLKQKDIIRAWNKDQGRVSREFKKKETDSIGLVKAINKLTGASYNYLIDGTEDQVVQDFYKEKYANNAEDPREEYATEVGLLRARVRDLEELNTMKSKQIEQLEKERGAEDGNGLSSKVG